MAKNSNEPPWSAATRTGRYAASRPRGSCRRAEPSRFGAHIESSFTSPRTSLRARESSQPIGLRKKSNPASAALKTPCTQVAIRRRAMIMLLLPCVADGTVSLRRERSLLPRERADEHVRPGIQARVKLLGFTSSELSSGLSRACASAPSGNTSRPPPQVRTRASAVSSATYCSAAAPPDVPVPTRPSRASRGEVSRRRLELSRAHRTSSRCAEGRLARDPSAGCTGG